MKVFKKCGTLLIALALMCSTVGCGGINENWLDVDVTQNKPTLSGLYPTSGMRDSEFQDSPTTRAFEEMTGYKVNYYQISGSNEEAEVGNALLEDNTYSFIKCARGAFDQYVVQDAFLDLTELLNRYGQNLLETISDDLWEACTYNGKIYAIPEYGYGDMQNGALVFNAEHLERAGITKLPETLTEFTDAIYKLQRTLGANDNNYHALAMSAASAIIPVLAGSFDVPKEFYEDENGKVTRDIYSDEMLNYIKYMNRLVRDNCLPANWDSAQDAQLMGWFTNENISVVHLPYWYVTPLCEQMTANKADKYPTVEAARAGLKWQTRIKGDGSDGSPVQEKGKLLVEDDIAYFITIPYQSRAQAAYTIDWMNTRITDENYRRFIIGEEGVSYEIVSESDATEDDVAIVEADGTTRYYRFLDGYAAILGNSQYATGGNPTIGRRYWPLREKTYDCWEILLPEDETELCTRTALAKCPVLPEWSEKSMAARSRIITYQQLMINTRIDGDESVRNSLPYLLKTMKSNFETVWTSTCAAQVQTWYDSRK